MDSQAPKYATRFLRWFCREDYLEEIEGNLIEIFEDQFSDDPRQARRTFIWQVLLHFRPDFIKSFKLSPIMYTGLLKNYFKVSWRSLLREKTYASINLLGLTVGFTCFLLIALFLQYELSYDDHLPNAERIYRVGQLQAGNTFRGTDRFAVSPDPLAAKMVNDIPEVEAATTLELDFELLSYGQEVFSQRGIYTDERYFDVFPMPIIDGIGAEALEEPNTILLSESLAEKFFGGESPLDKSLKMNNNVSFVVKGVFPDLPDNQTLAFDFMIPIEHYGDYRNGVNNWGSNNYNTFALLKDGASANEAQSKLSIYDNLLDEAYAEWPFTGRYYITPIQDLHLKSNANFELGKRGDISYVYLFGSIAFLILLLASINYTNLATARSVRRSKEVGMRKVVGARRIQLIIQLLTESFLLTLFSLVLSIGLVFFLLPYFNQILELEIPLGFMGNSSVLVGLLIIAVTIGILSGLYPALFLSKVSPIKAFQKSIYKNFNRGISLRNLLVVGQFTAAIVLGVGSYIVYQQMQYIQNKKLGYNREEVLFTTFFHKEIRENIPLIKQRLKQDPNIETTALSASLPTNTNNQGILSEWEGNEENRTFGIYRYYVDYDFLDLYEMEMVEGRYFSPAYPSDSSRAYIINEAALKATGWTSAIGKSFRDGQVIGVVKDFHFQPFDLKVEPLFMLLNTPEHRESNFGNLSIRIKNPDQAEETIAFIEGVFKDIAPMIPIQARFLEDTYNRLYAAEQRLAKVFHTFTILAMFIACLGLFGLVSFNLVQRTKEIGIRKVLGASSTGIVQLLSKDFLKLIVISVILAVPIGWYAMSQWLQSFAYSIQIKWWVFLITGLFVISTAMLTVLWQSFRASVANPVEAIRQGGE